MLFLVPHLFPSARPLEASTQGLRLPALQTLLARGSRQACAPEGVEAVLCDALGIERQQDWPLAPVTLETDGGRAGNAYWLRADPVHLRVMRDRVVLTDSSALSLSQQEADALATAISRHFGAALNPTPLRPQRWYLQLSRTPSLTTTPLSMATGCNIDPMLPQGADAMRFRAQLNELQMLLHDHPINLAREARGELPVNSLWLWGGGLKPAAGAQRVVLYARDEAAHALGAFCGTQVQPLPRRMEKSLLAAENVFVLDQLVRAGHCGDAYSWREALRVLEADWFAPLLRNLRSVGRSGLRLEDPVNGKVLWLKRSDVWKIWQRPRSLISLLG